jgi:hypothetical protein
MSIISKQYWKAIEAWSPTLFFVGFVLELIFALNHGAAYLVESVTFFDWIYPTVIVGRLAVLLGLAGLSVGLIELHPRIGKLSRVLLSGAMVFAVGLIATSILQNLGVTTPLIAVFGAGTVVFTLLSFILFGIAGLRTDAFPTVVGGLMLVASVAILFVLLGSGTFSTNIRGAVGESVNAIAFLAVWYVLRSRSTATTTTEQVTDTPIE